MKQSGPHVKRTDITSDVIMSWFRTFIVKNGFFQTQYLVPTDVLDLLLLWATKISLPASGLLHKERNPQSPLTNVLCWILCRESIFFFTLIAWWNWAFTVIWTSDALKTLYLRSATINTVTAVVYFEVSRLSDEVRFPCCMAADDNIMKKKMKPFISHRHLKCVIVCWSHQVLNPEQRPALTRCSPHVLLLNSYFRLISRTQHSYLANTNQVEIKPVPKRAGTLITHITRRASELSITRLAGLVLCIPTASTGRSPVH